MTIEAKTEANSRIALKSNSPKTGDGMGAIRFNAIGHGLRPLQAVVPGEAPEEIGSPSRRDRRRSEAWGSGRTHTSRPPGIEPRTISRGRRGPDWRRD